MADPPLNIFISYAHSDRYFVDRLEADLRSHGLNPWMDRDRLYAGQHWHKELQEALDRSQVLLVVLSPDAVDSEYVEVEYDYASEEGKVVIPLYYRPCSVPMELRGIQWVDFRYSYEQGIDTLLKALSTEQDNAEAWHPQEPQRPASPSPATTFQDTAPTRQRGGEQEEQEVQPSQQEHVGALSGARGASLDSLAPSEPKTEHPSNVPVRRNPFTYGNPISDSKRFFGRQLEVAQIFSRLGNVEFESSSLVGERRIGKTSLLNYLAHPDVRRSYGLDPDKYLFVYVDLAMIDKNTTPRQLWQRFLRQMARCCYDTKVKQLLEEMQQAQSIDNFALEDLFESLDEKDQYVVLLLDEFENVTENENFDPSFFYGLRSLAIHHNLSLITASRRELIELCHSEAIRSSPFFNIFANINLQLFKKDEALDLISKSLVGTGVSFTEAEIDLIFHIAGYHPYFLQAACSFLFDAYSQNLDSDKRIIFLRKGFREEASPHLAFYWNSSDDHEKIVLMALTLLHGQSSMKAPAFSKQQLQDLYMRSEQTLARLEKRGLLIATGDGFSLFSASFGEWIWNEIVDTSPDQQTYQEWLTSNKSAAEHLKGLADAEKKDLIEIIPRISGKYRELILNWLIEPRTLNIVGSLIKSSLASGFGSTA